MKQESIAFKKTTFDLKTSSERLSFAGTIVTIGAACTICVCIYLFWSHPLSPFAKIFVFFLAGIFHVLSIRKGLHAIASTGEWIITMVATGLILAFLGSSALWASAFPVYLMVSCAAAFLLPFTVMEMWRAHLQLALDGARIWYPTHERALNYPTFYFNSTHMRFRVLQGKGKPNVTIDFKVSNELSLGKIYYDLAKNKSKREGKEITLADAEQNLYGWIFFTTDGFVLSRPLDPEKTLQENGLHEKKVVYVQQITRNAFSSLQEQQNELTQNDYTRLQQ